MAKKKKESKYAKLINWLIAILVIAVLIGLAFLRNHTWLKKQNTKPFGYVERTFQ